MSTVNNNNSAWATRVMPTGDVDILFLLKVGSGAISNPDYSQPFELDFAGGNYLQLYLPLNSTSPTLRLWVNNTGDFEVVNFAGAINVWRKIRIKRTSNTWAFQHALIGATSWTQTMTFNFATTDINLGWWASFRDGPGAYLTPGASNKNFLIYTGNKTDSEALAALDTNSPSTTNLWASYMVGANPSPANFHVDQSGNSRNMSPNGTAITDSDDPIIVPAAPNYSLFFGMCP